MAKFKVGDVISLGEPDFYNRQITKITDDQYEYTFWNVNNPEQHFTNDQSIETIDSGGQLDLNYMARKQFNTNLKALLDET